MIRCLVFDCAAGKLRPAMAGRPVLSSGHLDWRGYSLERYQGGGGDLQDVFCVNTVVILQLREAIRLEWKEAQGYVEKQIEPGQICLFPPEVPYSVRSDDFGEFVAVSLDPTFMLLACQEVRAEGPPELAMVQGVRDRVVEGLCLGLMGEVRNGGGSGGAYADSLATTLAVHLAARYAVRKPRLQKRKSGLPQGQLRPVLRLIEERLQHDVTLQEMAAASGLSPFHFARQFKKATGLSPYQYVLKQRVEKAKRLLLRGELTIAAVAHEVGFCDQSHLTSHFKRFCGTTPREFMAWIAPARPTT